MQLFIARTTLDPQIRAVDKSVIEARREVAGAASTAERAGNDGAGSRDHCPVLAKRSTRR